MVDFSPLLTVPGNMILTSLAPVAAGDDEVRSSLEVTLGIVFWLVVLLLGRLAVSQLRRLNAGRRKPVGHAVESREAVGGTRRPARPVAWRAVVRGAIWGATWGATWRAQVVHVGLYLLVPLAWEALRGMLVLILVPFSIIGFGDRHAAATDGTLAHLGSPACWTFVGNCGGPRSRFLHQPVIDASTCVTPQTCAPGRSLVVDSGGWLWKSAWALLSIAWIVQWRRRLHRKLPVR